MDYIKVTDQPLELRLLYEKVRDPSCGAISSFVGTTRDLFEGKTVQTLEYEAYVPMAEKVFKQICEDLRKGWHLKHIAIAHRFVIEY